jgi:hypothetical protein
MPDTSVDLDVQTGSPPDDTWTICKDGTGANINYCCKFTGGDWPADDPNGAGGPGYFQATGNRGVAKHVRVELVATPIWRGPNGNGFKITDIEITPYPSDCSVQGADPAHRIILDVNNNLQEGTYTVIVAHKSEGGTVVNDINCHPGWRNN